MLQTRKSVQKTELNKKIYMIFELKNPKSQTSPCKYDSKSQKIKILDVLPCKGGSKNH